MNRAVIVEAKRTPIGKKNGMLKEYEVQQLTTLLLTFLSKGIEREIDDVILGNVVGPSPASKADSLATFPPGPTTLPNMTSSISLSIPLLKNVRRMGC